MAQGTFDEILRQESRRITSRGGGESARDRAARRYNVLTGRNPNPRTSTAYKEEKPAAKAKSTAKGGKGDGRQKSKPSKDDGDRISLPENAPTPTPNPNAPGTAPAGGDNPLWWLIPMILAGAGSRYGRSMMGPTGTGEPFAPRGPAPTPVETAPTPSKSPLALAAPSGTLALPYYPGEGQASLALPPPSPNDDLGRFMDESEIAGIKQRMYPNIPAEQPGTYKDLAPQIRVPGWYKGFRP